MTKSVKSLSQISLLGKSLSDLADEIAQGRVDAVAGVVRMAKAYEEGLRRFPTKAEDYFSSDPRTKWITRSTKQMLRMVAKQDLDPRVVLIPEPNLAGFIKEIPYKQQKALLDENPYVKVYDAKRGSTIDVPYIDITASQTEVAYDQKNMRFRTAEEQKNYIANKAMKKKSTTPNDAFYKRIGNTVRFIRGCEIGRNELAELVSSMGFKVTED